MSNNTANTIKTLMSNTSATKRIALYTQHLCWKAGNFGADLMVRMISLALLAVCTAVPLFVFWVKLQIVIWMFG